MTTRRHAASEIHGTLRERICLLKYPQGTVLRETDLANEFGVSRTPVREALQRLSVEGLVEIHNGVGTRVTKPDNETLRGVFKIRIELAGILGRIGLRPVQPSDIAVLQSLIGRTEKLAQEFRVEEYWDINHMLHYALNDLILIEQFRDYWDSLYFRGARAWYELASTISADATDLLHHEVVELERAMRFNDAEALGHIKRAYISYCFERLEQQLSASVSE